MSKVINAIFENGVFRPLSKIAFPEHQKVKLVIEEDEIQTKSIAVVAEKSKSFYFLKNQQEDIYTIRDGEPI
ncbi:MAG: antitoxin family protein [Elusimicrobiota bacterium]